LTLADQPLDQGIVAGNIAADQKERRACIVVGENFQELRRGGGIRAVVECQRYDPVRAWYPVETTRVTGRDSAHEGVWKARRCRERDQEGQGDPDHHTRRVTSKRRAQL